MDNDQKRQAVGRMKHQQDQQGEQSSQSLTSDNHVPDEPDVTKHGVAEAGTTEPTTATTTRTSTPSSTPSTSNTAATATRLLDIDQEKQAALASRVVQTLLREDHHNHRDYEREQDGSTTCRPAPAAPGTNPCTTINVEEERAAARTSVVTLALIPDHQSPQTIKQQQHLDNHRDNHACSTATATATSLASSSTLNTTIISTNRSLANHPKHQHQQQQLDDAQILQQASLEAPCNQKQSILGPPWTRHPHEYSPQNVIPGAFAAGPLGTVERRDVLAQDLQQQLQQQQQPMAAVQDINTNNSNHDEDNNHSNTNNQLGLVVAQPIHENVEEKNLHQAIPQDMETERERQLQKEESFRKWTIRLTLLMCAVLVIIIVAVALTVPDNPGKTTNDETNGSLTSSSSANNSVRPAASSPTMAPSMSFVLNLPEFTMQAIANNPNSSQALAYDWLEQDPARGNYSEARQLQRMALATLYYATGGPNWLIQSDWMSYTVDECAWYSKVNVTGTTQASTCDEDGNYLELVLTLNGLAGSLPTELMLLTKLATLDVATNEIGGTIFTEIGSMSSTLKALIIDANQIGGTIPTELGLLTNLEVLICHTLQLEKSIPTHLGQMTSLVNVNIFDNPLMTGSLPTELGRLTNLEEFKVYFPSLSGTIPSELGNLVNMDLLDIRRARQLTGSIPSDLGRWTKARIFFMEKTMITGTLPTELGQLAMLEELVINWSELSGSVPSEFGLLSSMKRTKLNFNARMGGGDRGRGRGRGIPSELGNLVNLQVLEFIYSPLGASIPSELGRLTLLEQLGLESLMLTGTVPTEVWALSSLLGFSISLNYNLSGNIATEIGLATSLTFLGAYETSLSGSIPSEVGLCAHLKTIYLHNSSLTGSIPSEMAAIADLSDLWIGGNHEMTGTFPYLLANQTKLSARESTIILNGTQLRGEIPDVLCSAQELSYDCPPMCGCDCPCSE